MSCRNVSYSRGEIEKVFEAKDGTVRYAIRNENTGKTTNYQDCAEYPYI